MIAVVPEIWFAKYKPAITMGASILTTLSTEPMFFFQLIAFLVNELITPQKSTNESSCTATFVTQAKIFSEEEKKPVCGFLVCFVISKMLGEHFLFILGFEEK